MKKILVICFILGGFLISSASAAYTPDDMGCAFIKPPDWKIDYKSDEAILLSDSLNEYVRIEIYKYLLESDQQIGSEEELIEAVQGLYEEIGIDISPEAKMVCTFEDSLVFFETDFIDSASSESIIYHVIISIIYLPHAFHHLALLGQVFIFLMEVEHRLVLMQEQGLVFN